MQLQVPKESRFFFKSVFKKGKISILFFISIPHFGDINLAFVGLHSKEISSFTLNEEPRGVMRTDHGPVLLCGEIPH